jgi:hypothetical protein
MEKAIIRKIFLDRMTEVAGGTEDRCHHIPYPVLSMLSAQAKARDFHSANFVHSVQYLV